MADGRGNALDRASERRMLINERAGVESTGLTDEQPATDFDHETWRSLTDGKTIVSDRADHQSRQESTHSGSESSDGASSAQPDSHLMELEARR